ncbi:MAG: AraC family transcriptional regulator [Gemmatimonadaceae bacterium]
MRPTSQGVGIGEWELDGFAVVESLHAPGMALTRHEHRWPTISLVVAGDFAEIFADGPRWCERGTVLIKPAGVPHSNWYGRQGARCLIAEVRTAEDVGSQTWHGAGRVVHCVHGPLARLGSRVARAFCEWDDPSRMTVECILREIAAGPGTYGSRDSLSSIQRAMEYMHAEFRGSLLLRDVAAAAGVHPTYLARAFRRHFGRTPGDLLRELRVHWAAHLLAESPMSVSQIALEAGFTDQSHLTRVFTRRLGRTPARYRRDRRG